MRTRHKVDLYNTCRQHTWANQNVGSDNDRQRFSHQVATLTDNHEPGNSYDVL